ncbi:MAG TPA: two-component regulator propeller domain-containing protein [Chitinophagaceae bacterium]|nr:two-component regulator propeller domain-containing protein [Chitinophagaceae bacterium]
MNNCGGIKYGVFAKNTGIAACLFIVCCLLYLQPCAQLKPYYLFKFDKINTGVKPFNQTVLCMAQDSIGFMWFGTSNGLYRYDGNSFDRFEFDELHNIETRSLLVDSKKNIWIGTTWEELYKYDMYHHRLSRFIYDSSRLGNNSGEIFKMCEGENNTVWFASAAGLFTINPANGKYTWLTKQSSQGICLYNDTMWVGLTTGGIQCFNPHTGAILSTPVCWQFLQNPNYIVTYLYAGGGKLWAGTNLGLFRQDGGGRLKVFVSTGKTERGLPYNEITGICAEKDTGYTWICTPKGIALYEEESSGFVPVQNNAEEYGSSITDKSMVCILRDASGKIWIGTGGAGIFSFYPRKIKVYSHSITDATSIHSNNIKRVFIFNNRLLATVYTDGVDIIDPFTKTCNFYPFYNSINPTFSTIQYPSEKDDRSIFIGAATGLFSFDVYTHTYTPVLPEKYNSRLKNVQAAKYDNSHNLWIGCEEYPGGLYVYNNQNDNLREFKEGRKGLLANNINLLVPDADSNMVICNYSAVQKYLPAVDSFLHLNRGLEREVASAGVCFAAGDNGISFAGTYQNGIYLVDKKLKILSNITESKGLSSNTVLSFLKDGNNTIWASTLWGINKIIFSDEGKKNFIITHIDNTDGLPGEMVINMVMHRHGDDKTYFLSTNNGLAEAKAEDFQPDAYKPPVVITSLAVSDTVIKTLDSSHLLSVPVYLTKSVRLAYWQNTLQVTFAALNYINQQKDQYAYMLKGVDKDWIYTQHNYSASYSNLRPGTYTFLVRASNDAGAWSEKTASLQFIIAPPFWQTIWAYLLYAISAAAAIYAVYVSRIKQYRLKQETQLRTMIATQEEERKRISRDLHDDIGTKLSALKLFVSTFKNNLQKHQYRETETLAQNTEELIDETIRDVRVMLMNLSPGILEEFGYVTAVEGLVNKINETKIILINLVIFGIKERFAKEYELALYRITQELVNNILKHAEATNVSLQIGYRDGKIILMIEDDGKGFDVTAHKEGYGLKNLDARTTLLQGVMTIDSREGNGTSVLVEIPYQFN